MIYEKKNNFRFYVHTILHNTVDTEVFSHKKKDVDCAIANIAVI